MSIRTIILLALVSALYSYGIAQDVTCNLLTNTTGYWPPATLNKPDYLQTIIDPTFGTKITRIVGNPGDPIPRLSGAVWPADQERHEYSKLSVWNCDQSMMYLNRLYPNLWLDGNTYQVLFTRTKPGENVLWSHTEPNIMYHTGPSTSCYLGKWDVVKNVDSNLVDLRGYNNCTFGESEGNFTWDGSKVAIYGLRVSDGKYVIFVVDVMKRTNGPDMNAPVDFLGRPSLDNCTLSPRGTYIIMNDGNDHLQVWKTADGTIAWTESQYGVPSHFDTQIDQNGDEVIAGVTKTSISGIANTGIVIKRKLSDGTITALTKGGYASHTSGRNLKRPGWVFVTFEETYNVYPPYTNEIDAVKLDGSRVERICNIRDNNATFQGDTYVDESHGCPSPDGLRVIFASDWNKGTYPVQAYVVDYRDRVNITGVVASGGKSTGPRGALLGNYPNPFNSTTNISFTVAVEERVVVKVIDLLGREVATLFDGDAASGREYHVPFNAGPLPSGMYVARLEFAGQRITNKMIVLK